MLFACILAHTHTHTAMAVTNKVGAVPPTKAITIATYSQAKVKPQAMPQPPGAAMTGKLFAVVRRRHRSMRRSSV